MYKYHNLNPISKVGLDEFTKDYAPVSTPETADAILVRSAAMHEMEFATDLKAIARAGAGVNNIPLEKCAEQGIVVFNTPGANANGVKELVIIRMVSKLISIFQHLLYGIRIGFYIFSEHKKCSMCIIFFQLIQNL